MMELVNCRVKQQNGNNYGDWLIEQSRQDPVVVHEVTTRLKEVTKPMDDLSRRLSYFKAKLEDHLMSERDFLQIVDGFESKLRKLEDGVLRLRPVSALYSKARGQHEEFKPVFREAQNVKKVHETVLLSRQAIERGSQIPELHRRWNVIWDTLTKYHLQITAILPFEEIFHYSVMRFAPWLQDTEKKTKQIESRVFSRPEEIDKPMLRSE